MMERPRARRVRWLGGVMGMAFALAGCGSSSGDPAAPARRGADTVPPPGRAAQASAADTAAVSLARPFGDVAYRVETVAVRATGILRGRVLLAGTPPAPRAITPTHDEAACDPFEDVVVPSRGGGVGNAVVWITGVTAGPSPNLDRRMSLALDRCQIVPRVLLMPVGGTLLVTSGDAMRSRLRFIDAAGAGQARATMDFSDAGQLIPSSAIAATPALLAVRDDRHPWVRGTVVVTPHPYVAVTASDGVFEWTAVPDGTYTLWVWQEAYGVTSQRVRVHAGVETRIEVRLP